MSTDTGNRDGLGLAHLAGVIDRQRLQRVGRNLRKQPAQLFAQAQIGADQRQRAQVDVRHVDRIVDDAVEQKFRDGLRDFDADALLRLGGRRAEVRRKHDVGQRAKRQIVRRRFLLINVQRGAGDVTALQRLEQRGFLDQTAAGAIDDAHAGLALGKRLRVQDVLRLRRHRHVDGDEVGAAQERIEIIRQLHLQAACAALHEIRVVRDHVHPESNRPPRDLAADAAHADNAQRLAAKLGSLERFAVPLARDHRRMRLRNFARQARASAKRCARRSRSCFRPACS